jgi:hypothetical protein
MIKLCEPLPHQIVYRVCISYFFLFVLLLLLLKISVLKVIPPTFFLEIIKYNCNKINIYHGYILYNVMIIFTQSPLYQHTFPTFALDAVCGSVQLLNGPQYGVLGVHTSGGQREGSRRLLDRDCRENEG